MFYKVNLLPTELQREGLIDVRRLVVISAVTLFLALTLGGYGAFLINYTLMKNDLKDTGAQLTALTPLVSRVEQIRKERTGLEAALKEYAEILQKQKAWSVMLYDLSGITPIDLWLVELEILNKAVDPNTQPPGAAAKAPASNPQTKAKDPGEQEKKEPAGLPRPNTITFKGYSRTVSSIGVFINNLNYLPYFNEVKLDKISTDNEGIRFEVTATVKDES